MQDCGNSSALSMRLLQSCAKPSVYYTLQHIFDNTIYDRLWLISNTLDVKNVFEGVRVFKECWPYVVDKGTPMKLVFRFCKSRFRSDFHRQLHNCRSVVWGLPFVISLLRNASVATYSGFTWRVAIFNVNQKPLPTVYHFQYKNGQLTHWPLGDARVIFKIYVSNSLNRIVSRALTAKLLPGETTEPH